MAKVVGLVNLHSDVDLKGLTEKRPVASVSFLGRYGIIDFVLSNMSNSKIDNVGVLIKEKPRSLFKHLGSMDEIVCAIIYGVYITMYLYIIKNFKYEKPLKRYVMPIIAIIGSLFFVICGTGLYQLIFTGSVESLKAFGVFMLLFAVLMLPSLFFYNKNGKETIKIE